MNTARASTELNSDLKSKKKLSQRLSMGLARFLLPYILKCLALSYRVKVVSGQDHWDKAKTLHPKGSHALAVWHSTAFGCVLAVAWKGICLLISHSKDGDLTSHAVHGIGFGTVRGSSSKGGKEARDEITERFREGLTLGITVDGPRGPVNVVKPGVIKLASDCQIPIVPYTSYAPRSWVLRSWDKLRIPKPFAKVYIAFGEPIMIPKDLDREGYETAMKDLGQKITELGEHAKTFI